MKLTLDQRLETKWHPQAFHSSATGLCPELDAPAFNQHTSGSISGLISKCGPAAQSLVWGISFPCTASSPPHGTARPHAYTACIAWDVTHNFYGPASFHLNCTCVTIWIRFHNNWIKNTEHPHPCLTHTANAHRCQTSDKSYESAPVQAFVEVAGEKDDTYKWICHLLMQQNIIKATTINIQCYVGYIT